MKQSNSLLFLTLVCSFGCAMIAADINPVPVMMWRSMAHDGSVSSQSIPALTQLDSAGFQSIARAESSDFKCPIVMFLRRSLCTEDLKYREDNGVTCYSNLASYKNKKYCPAVKDSFTAMKQLNKTESYTDVKTTNDLEHPLGDERITYVNMPDQLEGETNQAYNARCDRIIAAVVAKYSSSCVLFMYSGERCILQPTVRSRQVRDVSAVNAAQRADPAPGKAPGQILKNPNLLLYFTELRVYSKSQNSTVEEATLTVSGVTETEMKGQVKSGTLTLGFAVNELGGSWYLQNIEVNGKQGALSRQVNAPRHFSYKCAPAVNITVAAGDDIVAVAFFGLQIQPKFGDVGTSPLLRFGDVNDCTGFTSIGIWSGLIVSFLLLSILTMGLSWILDIRTMDRFDDPKGACPNHLLLISLHFQLNFDNSPFSHFWRRQNHHSYSHRLN